MYFSLNINTYRVSKLFLFYKRMHDMNEDVFRYYPIVLCELTVYFYFKMSLCYEIHLFYFTSSVCLTSVICSQKSNVYALN